MRVRTVLAAAAVGLSSVVGLAVAPASAAGATTISGTAFQDLDRDGARDANEPAFEGHRIYAYDAAGTAVGNALTDAAGNYTMSVPDTSTYRIRLGSSSWWAIWLDWAPTTTGGTLQPVRYASGGAAGVDFGWRQIVRSTDPNAPISAYTGPSGLTVKSYDDVVPAVAIHDAIAAGAVGAEASTTTVRFDLGDSDITNTYVGGSAGSYSSFSARVYVTYQSWLSGQTTLIHEYGHAWTLHKAYLYQQDPSFAGYLEVRGLTGDTRLGSSHAWSAAEMIAEDYRQLLGAPAARGAAQENRDIADADTVPGLADYLAGAFSTPKEPATATEPAPSSPAPPAVSEVVMNPDPVSTNGRVAAQLSSDASVSVAIIDARGAVIRKLAVSVPSKAGSLSFDWDRKDDRGRKVRRGSFSVVVQAANAGGSTSASDTFTTT